MLDDLRNSASSSFEEKPPEKPEAPKKAPEFLILGMNAVQRFVVSLMVFLTVVVVGALILVAADKVVINLPALFGF